MGTTYCRQTQCWRNCNQGCLFCFGCSCETSCCQEEFCASCCTLAMFDCKNCEINPCLLREHSNQYLIDVLNEFEFKAHYKDKWFQEVDLIEHKQSQELIILKIVEETNHTEQRNLIEVFGKRQQIEHQNLVQLRRVINKQVDTFCSLVNKNYLFFDYIMQDLESLIKFRQEKSIFFKEDEVFAILLDTISGLQYLKQIGINHNCLSPDRIYQNSPNLFKIADPALFDDKPYYQHIFQERECKKPGVFLSPNELAALRKGEELPIHNKEKTDVFMVGMIMLYTASLSPVDGCYDYVHGLLFLDKIQQKLEIVKAKYHDSLYYIIRDMLTEKENERPNLAQVLERLQRNPRVKQTNTRNLTQTQFKTVGMQSQAGQQSQAVQSQVVKSIAMMDQTVAALPMDSNPMVSRVQGLEQTKLVDDQPLLNQTALPNIGGGGGGLDQYQLDPQIQEILNRPNNDYNVDLNLGGGYGSVGAGAGGYGGLGNISGIGGGMGGGGMDYNFGGLGATSYGGGGYSTNLGGGLGSIGGIGSLGGGGNTGLYSGGATGGFNKTSMGGLGGFGGGMGGGGGKNYITFDDDDDDDDNLKGRRKGDNYVVENYNNGSKYEGYKKKGMRDGKGKYYYNNGGVYDGTWKNNKMHGYGQLYFKDGAIAYDGQFFNNEMQGNGTLYNEFPDKNQSPIEPKNLTGPSRERWTKYEGDFNKGQKKGFGNLYFGNGEKYVGGFIDDNPHGQGTYYYKDGRPKLQGVWNKGIFQN